jgi:TolA-binding protein
VPVTRALAASRPDAVDLTHVATNFIGCPLIAELRYPTIALSPLSTAKLYVQTSSALKRAGREGTNAFDVTVPGTLKYEFAPGDVGPVSPPPGYREVLVRGNPYALDPLDDGRFTFVIPMRLGEGTESVDATALAETMPSLLNEDRSGPTLRVSYVDEEGKTMTMIRPIPWPILPVRPDDVITVAFEITGETNQPSRWITQRVVLSADAFFDAMEQRYQQMLRTVYVGERVYMRIIDPLRDTSNGKDLVTIKVPLTGSSVTQDLSLVETFAHSGIFKGSFQAAYSGTASNAVQTDIVPVNYGDTINLTYHAAAGGMPVIRPVMMHKGADGTVLPFTKRFKEPGVAVQTQFTIAEAYFELAKKHRELKQDDLARREIAQGKKLLEEAIRDYPETEERAHADYLLANLAMEYAEELTDPEAKKQRYMEAITRFSDLVSSYSSSPYAPKSQFKKALAFDKLGQLDQACEEYVKLSYRYPDNELVAETIARLGQYFMTKGKEFQNNASAETDIVKKEKARLQMLDMFKSAARVFERLSVRFPDHTLAGKTTVLAAQCWIRAEELDKAIAVFGSVIDGKKGDSDLIAQSMYWSGDCYLKKLDYINAYRLLKRLTWDYPETTWAKYARGRLSEKELAAVEETEATK